MQPHIYTMFVHVYSYVHVITLYYIQVECGSTHALFLTDSGNVYIWEESWQLKESVSSSDDAGSAVLVADTLKPVDSLKDIVYIACESGYSLALAADGALYSWGKNDYGQVIGVCGVLGVCV